MTEIFKHRLIEGDESDARRHVNPASSVGGIGSYYCADCAEALDFPDVTGPHPEARADG